MAHWVNLLSLGATRNLLKHDPTFLGDIINRRADFIVNGCFVKDYLTNRLEFTTSIYDDKLCIVTKTAALVCTKSINILFRDESHHAVIVEMNE